MKSVIFYILIIVVILRLVQCFHKIDKRFLIFPQAAPTRTQLIVGVGVPVDLERETITTGAVLKSQFLLPYNATQLYQGLTASGLPAVRKSKRRKMTKSRNPRVAAYKILESFLNKQGHDGLDCVLRAICESAATPFLYRWHFWSEIFHIFFTPSSSPAELQLKPTKIYLNAELAGKAGDPCDLHYSRCSISLIDTITKVL